MFVTDTPEIHDFKTSLASSLSLEKSSSSFLGSIQYHAGIHGTKLIGPGPKKPGRSGTGPELSQYQKSWVNLDQNQIGDSKLGPCQTLISGLGPNKVKKWIIPDREQIFPIALVTIKTNFGRDRTGTKKRFRTSNRTKAVKNCQSLTTLGLRKLKILDQSELISEQSVRGPPIQRSFLPSSEFLKCRNIKIFPHLTSLMCL